MNLAAVYHEAKSKYAYAYDRETLHFRVRTARGDIDRVTLVGGDPFRWIQSEEDPSHWEWDKTSAFFVDMALEYQTELYDYWFVAVQPQWKRIRYAFVLHKGAKEILFGSRGHYDLAHYPDYRYKVSLFFNYPYINFEDLFTAPAWVKDTVWYQIFPERYADGDPANNPPGALPWASQEQENIRMFFGGDLQGVLDNLDELVDLGVNGIYFTPIFESPSSHKYDTTDYYRIDPHFGTNELFGRLVQAAHDRGIRIMLDAVFNHCGWFHPWWQDVVKNGRASQYYDCFLINADPVINFEVEEGQLPKTTHAQRSTLNYSTFGFVPNMPKWNTDHPLVKEHLLGAIRYWTETFGVDGWRLDVSNEVSHDFWREFRKLVKGINPEIFILGENWDNSYPWLQGDQFDAVMNYELTYPIWNLLGEGDAIYESYNVRQYQVAINQLLVNYPKHNLQYMYNMVDSHDTPRILSICANSPERVKQAFVLEMTFVGAPSVFYGSEVGLTGPEGHNRRCMPWESATRDQNLRTHVKTLIRLRKAHPAFKTVDLTWLEVSETPAYFIFAKQAENERIFVIINHEPETIEIALPDELKNTSINDLIASQSISLGDRLTLQADGFRILQKAV